MPQPDGRGADLRRGGGRELCLRPLLALSLAATLPLALLACGDDEDEVSGSLDDETVRQISGVAELATYAYAAVGAEGLYDYLSESVTGSCTKQELKAVLKDKPLPSGFRRIEDVTPGEDSTVTAQVVQLFGDEERREQWVFVAEDNDAWRIASAPGIEECGD